MGVFGNIYAGRFGVGTANSFFEGLRKKLETELQQQQALERAKQQFGFQQQLAEQQAGLQRQNTLFGELLRLRGELVKSGVSTSDLASIDAAIQKAAAGQPLTEEELQAAFAPLAQGFQEANTTKWLQENWMQVKDLFTDPAQAKAFEDAARNKDWAAAMRIATEAGIDFNKARLAQQQAQAGMAQEQYSFLQDTHEARVAQEHAKALGLDLQNEETKLRMDLAVKNYNLELERLGIDKQRLEMDKKSRDLADKMLQLQIDAYIEDRPAERERKLLEVENLKKDLLRKDIEARGAELRNALTQQQIDENTRMSGIRMVTQITQLAKEDPEAAKAVLTDDTKEALRAIGVNANALDAYISNVERLKRFEDPARAEALKGVELALQTPPPPDTPLDKISQELDRIEQRLRDAKDANGNPLFTDAEIRTYMDAVIRFWNNNISQAELAQVKLALEQAKLQKDANDEWIKVQEARRKALADTASSLTKQITNLEAQLQTIGCGSSSVINAMMMYSVSQNPQFREYIPPQCTAEGALNIARQLMDVRKQQQYVTDELTALAVELGARPPQPEQPGASGEGLTPDELDMIAEGVGNDIEALVKQRGKPFTPEEALKKAADAGLPEDAANVLLRKLEAAGLVKGQEGGRKELTPEDKAAAVLDNLKRTGAVVTYSALENIAAQYGLNPDWVISEAGKRGLKITGKRTTTYRGAPYGLGGRTMQVTGGK